MQATTTQPDNRLSRMKDTASRTPPWAWRLAATGAGMVAAALVGKAVRAGEGRLRSRSALVRWAVALTGTAVAGIAASKGRNLAQGAVTRAWSEGQGDTELSVASPAGGATSSSNGRNR